MQHSRRAELRQPSTMNGNVLPMCAPSFVQIRKTHTLYVHEYESCHGIATGSSFGTTIAFAIKCFFVFESDERRIVALSRLPVSTFANGYDLRGFDAPHFS
jgi:hypothetical protein